MTRGSSVIGSREPSAALICSVTHRTNVLGDGSQRDKPTGYFRYSERLLRSIYCRWPLTPALIRDELTAAVHVFGLPEHASIRSNEVTPVDWPIEQSDIDIVKNIAQK